MDHAFYAKFEKKYVEVFKVFNFILSGWEITTFCDPQYFLLIVNNLMDFDISMFVIPLLFNILWLNVHVSVKHCSELSGTNSTQLPLIHFVVACRDKINKWHLIPGYTYPQTCQFISCLYMHPTFDLVNQPKTKD